MKKSTWIIALVFTLLVSVGLIGCQSGPDEDQSKDSEAEDAGKEEDKEGDKEEDKEGDKEEDKEEVVEVYEGDPPVVTMTMEDGGEMVMELYAHIAPNSVNNFIALIEDGFYDGVTFHRVVPGFMIQGGDPDGNGSGGPGHYIKGEFGINGFENNLTHERGVLSMARSQSPDSAGSQFFIIVEDSDFLDGEYAAFGKVIEGIEVADEIVGVDRDGNDKPDEEQVIETMTVELNGYEPAEVVKE